MQCENRLWAGFGKSGLLLLSISVGLFACQKENPAQQPVTTAIDTTEPSTHVSATPDPAQASLPELAQSIFPEGRLSRAVLPEHYRLAIKIVPQESHFTGRVEIDLELTEPVSGLWLHGWGLDVLSGSIKTETGEQLPVTYTSHGEYGESWVDFGRPLDIQHATLSLVYKGPFNQALDGLYKVVENGQAYAFTQFEAIAARRAFPAFDEPSFKVPFDITLTVPLGHTAISNTPVINETQLTQQLKRVQFATTKPLPTYLVAFAVGPFDVVTASALPVTAVRDREIPLRGIAVKGKGQQLGYALEHTRAILESLETYFGIPYPYAKLDLIAVPDFRAGAMENAGAITYRESLLLFNETATLQRKRAYQRVHAHELAHQWFGNLVTPYWWNDIWLNEAFATWMAYVALDDWRPAAGFRRDLASTAIGAMQTDSLISARQIRQPVASNHDIVTAFDSITYRKGGGVISMFEQFLGRSAFRQGIQNYLRQHAWGNASSEDFIRALAEQSGTHSAGDVAAAFRSFLEQPGLPLLNIEQDCSESQPKLVVQQQRYLPIGSQGQQTQHWQLPLCMRLFGAESERDFCTLIKQQRTDLSLPATDCPRAIMPSSNGVGYYRWNSSAEAWNQLLAESDRLSEQEQIALASALDANLAAGTINIGDWLQLLPRTVDFDAPDAILAPVSELQFLYDDVAQSQAQKSHLRELFASLYAKPLDDLGLQAQGSEDGEDLQGGLVDFMAHYARLPDLRAELLRLANQYTGYGVARRTEINPNIITTALEVGVQEQGAPFVEHLLGQLTGSRDAVARARSLRAIGVASDPASMQKIHALLLSPEIRANEIFTLIFQQMTAEPAQRDAMWRWVQDNFSALLARMPERSQGAMIRIGGVFCSVEKANELRAFFEPKLDELLGGPRHFKNTMEAIDLCHQRAEVYRPQLRQWLEGTEPDA